MKRVACTSVLVVLLAVCGAGHPNSAIAADDSVKTDFSASLGLNEYYTDNVYYSHPLFTGSRLGDWVTVLLPTFNYSIRDNSNQVNLGASAEIGRFAKYTSENYEDFKLYANGRHRIDPLTLIVWGGSFGRNHESRSSPELGDIVGKFPTIYWQTSAYGAISHRFGDNSVRIGATFNRYDFQDVPSIAGPIINNDDRDRNMVTSGVRLTHDLGDNKHVYIESLFDGRFYDHTPDDNTFKRDSNGFRGIVGWQQKFGTSLDADIYGGIIYQHFADGRFSDVVAPDFGGSLKWRPAEGTVITARGGRSVEETTLFGSSSYLRTYASLTIQQLVRGDLSIYAGASLSDLNYQDSSRDDKLTSAWLGIRKYVTPRIYVGLEASYQERDSNIPADDYTESRIMARFGVQTDKAFEAGQLGDTAPGPVDFYVGARAGVSHLGTMLDGPRENGTGSLTADFGNFGVAGNIAAGVGVDVARWYMGLEADAGLASLRWDHSRLPGGRVFSVSRHEDYGLSMLVGRRLAGGTLLYARAGPRLANFETRYASSMNAARRNETELGFQFGVGVQAPVSDSMTVTMEYVHAVYGDYPMGVGMKNVPDRFANTESDVRLGIAYHFNGISRRDDPPVRSDFSGAYWGLQAGHGAIASHTTGDRQPEGTPPVISQLNADFGDTGFTVGGLAGYNLQWGNMVVGGEFDADAARQQWNHVRTPGGRTFSVEKLASLGGSLRAGYVLGGQVLLYGRFGVVGSLFDTRYATGMVSVADESWQAGWRAGFGMEVPLTQATAVRFDYTYTDYGKHKLPTSNGVETYRTRESLFRLGAIFRF